MSGYVRESSQHWLLLGTTNVSQQVWGLGRIGFPCGYLMHPGAFVGRRSELVPPAAGTIWAVAGFAIEISGGGKNLTPDQAAGSIAGYRPWVALFHDCLLDELRDLGHTIEMWDRGVSIFYGLWKEAGQQLGPLFPSVEFSELRHLPVQLIADGETEQGTAPSELEYDAVTIIEFMTRFMTLDDGDIFILGPLVASRIGAHVSNICLRSKAIDFTVPIAR